MLVKYEGLQHGSENIPSELLLQHVEGGVTLLEIGEKIRIIYANPGLYRILGIEKDSWLFPCTLEEIGLQLDYEADYGMFFKTCGRRESGSRKYPPDFGGREEVALDPCAGSQSRTYREWESRYAGISTDITELMEKGEKLKECSERLKVACGQTPQVLWEVNIERKSTVFMISARNLCGKIHVFPIFRNL